MTKKALKVAAIVLSILLVALTAGVVMASTKEKAQIPEYVGSQACLGCHTDKYVGWETTNHAGSENVVREIKSEADLPLPLSAAPAELQGEIAKATHYFHNRLLQMNLTTGELMYLGVDVSADGKSYVAAPSRKGTTMDGTCGGCHAGMKDSVQAFRTEAGIGCEQCHGPGRDHILGKGDPSKIFNSNGVESCQGCHSGYNGKPNSTRWPVGYRPGMTLDQVGFMTTPADPTKTAQPMHHKGAVPQWQASAHATAVPTLEGSGHAQDRCYECHSGEARKIIEEGGKFSAKDHKVTDGVGCTACHDPHNGTNEASLREEPKELCASCHTAEIAVGASLKAGAAAHHPNKEMLAGYGAVGITATPGAHTEKASCVECHMTGANHLMKVVKPEDVEGTTQKDTCTTCHTNSTAESRGMYLNLWQNTINAKMKDIKYDMDIVDAALKTNPSALTGDLLSKYQAAKTNYSFVDADGSHGAHNFEYAMKILTQAQKDVAAARKAVAR